MPRITARNNETKEEVTFEWHGDEPPTDADMDEIFSEAAAQKIPAGAGDPPARDWGDTATDLLPLAGGIAGGILGAPAGPGAIGTAALGGAAGQGLKRVIEGLRGRRDPSKDTTLSVAKDLGIAGLEQGVGQATGMGAAKVLSKLGRTAATGSLGAQASVRKKFPTVDLEGVALREGMPNAAKAARLSKAANTAVSDAVQQADLAGAAPITADEINRGLRPLYTRMRQAGLTENARDVLEAGRLSQRRYPKGLRLPGAQILKQEEAIAGRAAQAGAADPRAASMAARIAQKKGKSIASALRSRSSKIGEALDRSQELMALDKAMQAAGGRTPLLRNLLIAAPAAGGLSGGYYGGDTKSALSGAAAGFALTNPRSLALLARLLTAGAPAGREAARAGTVGLASLLPSHDRED